MSNSSYVVASRANILARIVLVIDLLLAVAIYFSAAPTGWFVAPAVAALLLFPYLRYVSRSPALWTIGILTLAILMLIAAGPLLGAYGIALWVLLPLTPPSAGYVLGRRIFVSQVAGIGLAALAIASIIVVRNKLELDFTIISQALFVTSLVVSLITATWFASKAVRPDPTSTDLLGPPLQVAKSVVVVPFNWVVGGVQSEALRLELHTMRRTLSPRWIVLDLAPAGELGRRDLSAIERAAEEITTSYCTVVVARPPVDTLGHLDIAQPVVGRVERFATVPQAVEAGLRRLGWTQEVEQGQRIVTHV
ncbi:MAG: hypothetical protein KDI07_01965 [Anaerolineae bacterium]|nr:hypothetical protein [Anaerolineae bacterium]MCB9131260.1 hypothetical protein [Anaerolineales bacterium]MCB0227593.1 hypothetical protein [Anaerolineae bacterium]MCB0233609.1 hypothetical protein [Anaerolineae bacterium]MCB0239535.1 hypothetical protein [Anaerolineae bacterium]